MEKDNKGSDEIGAGETATTASPARFRCPENLAQLFELMNLISNKTVENYVGIISLDGKSRLSAWIEIFEKLPEQLKNYIKKTSLTDSHHLNSGDKVYYDYLFVFETLLAVRALLASIEPFAGKSSTDINKETYPLCKQRIEQHNSRSALKHLLTSNTFEEPGSPDYSSLIDVEISPDFTMYFTFSPLIEAVIGADIRRIRRCRFCRKFFWAERYDALGCSPRCSNALRQRRLRKARMMSTD